MAENTLYELQDSFVHTYDNHSKELDIIDDRISRLENLYNMAKDGQFDSKAEKLEEAYHKLINVDPSRIHEEDDFTKEYEDSSEEMFYVCPYCGEGVSGLDVVEKDGTVICEKCGNSFKIEKADANNYELMKPGEWEQDDGKKKKITSL